MLKQEREALFPKKKEELKTGRQKSKVYLFLTSIAIGVYEFFPDSSSFT
jgi:hypothetical protein